MLSVVIGAAGPAVPGKARRWCARGDVPRAVSPVPLPALTLNGEFLRLRLLSSQQQPPKGGPTRPLRRLPPREDREQGDADGPAGEVQRGQKGVGWVSPALLRPSMRPTLCDARLDVRAFTPALTDKLTDLPQPHPRRAQQAPWAARRWPQEEPGYKEEGSDEAVDPAT